MKKVILATLLIISTLITSTRSYAIDGEIVFKDAMYGAAIGGLAGGSLYLVDSNDFGAKVGIGVFLGLLAGAAIGVYESEGAFVQIDNGKVKLAMPDIKVEKNSFDTYTKVNLFGAKF